MARPDVAEILADCVSDIKVGHRLLPDCLAAYPELRDELQPLLTLAQSIAPPPLKPDPIRKMQARYRFVEALHRERRKGLRWRHYLWPALDPLQGSRAVPVMLAVLLAVTLGTTGGVALASQGAQPGDPLYGVKTAIEQVQVATAFAEDGKAEVQLQIAERRLQELLNAVDADNGDAVARAGEGSASAIAEARKHLAKAQEQGKDVGKALDRLAASQERRREALRRARGLAAGPTLRAVERERELDEERARHGPDGETGRLEREDDDERGPGDKSDDVRGQRDQAIKSDTQDRDNSGHADGGGRSGSDSSSSPSAGNQLSATAPAAVEPDDAIDGIIGKVEDLANSPKVSGESLRRLLAKLKAAKAALERGQRETALNQLAAFRNQLDTLNRAGHVSDSSYNDLLADYSRLATLLNSRSESGDDRRGGVRPVGDSIQTPVPDVSADPTARATATSTPGRVNPGQGSGSSSGSGKRADEPPGLKGGN